MPDLPEDEDENAASQDEDVVGQVSVVDVAEHDSAPGLDGDDVEDPVLVGQRDEQDDHENLEDVNSFIQNLRSKSN